MSSSGWQQPDTGFWRDGEPAVMLSVEDRMALVALTAEAEGASQQDDETPPLPATAHGTLNSSALDEADRRLDDILDHFYKNLDITCTLIDYVEHVENQKSAVADLRSVVHGLIEDMFEAITTRQGASLTGSLELELVDKIRSSTQSACRKFIHPAAATVLEGVNRLYNGYFDAVWEVQTGSTISPAQEPSIYQDAGPQTTSGDSELCSAFSSEDHDSEDKAADTEISSQPEGHSSTRSNVQPADTDRSSIDDELDTISITSSLSNDAKGYLEARARRDRAAALGEQVAANVTKWKAGVAKRAAEKNERDAAMKEDGSQESTSNRDCQQNH